MTHSFEVKFMGTDYTVISEKGKAVAVHSTCIDGTTVVVTGKWLKAVAIHDEEWLQGELVPDPPAFVEKLKRSQACADWFTFAQKFTDSSPRYPYHFEWDNVAVIHITTFETWWQGLPQATRKNVRRAERRGVVVGTVEFSDELVAGIKAIYDETPIRQGRRFWHCGKPLDAVRRENSTYMDRSEFIAAYDGTELIGFIKMVYVGESARIMQILSKDYHADKRPGNALIAKAVEICVAKKMKYLIYGKYAYGGNRTHQLAEFKQRNGFQQLLFPRYYVPLSLKGKLAMKLNLHLGIMRILPEAVCNFLLKARGQWYEVTALRKERRPLPEALPRQDVHDSTPSGDAVSKAR